MGLENCASGNLSTRDKLGVGPLSLIRYNLSTRDKLGTASPYAELMIYNKKELNDVTIATSQGKHYHNKSSSEWSAVHM